MPKEITFSDEWQATEYAKIMESRGWKVLGVTPGKVIKDPETGYKTYVNWKVVLYDIKEGKQAGLKETEKLPGDLAEAMAQEEEGAKYIPRTKRQIRKGAKTVRKGLIKAPDEIIMGAATGRTLRPAMEAARSRRSYDVVRGMKKSIPRAMTGARTVFGEYSERPPGISTIGPARIATEPIGRIAQTGGMPLIAGTGLGVPRDIAFQAGAPKGLRFQAPKLRKLRVGHEAIPEEEEEE